MTSRIHVIAYPKGAMVSDEKGTLLGFAPNVFHVEPGQHSITVWKSGRVPITRSMALVDNQDYYIDAYLWKPTAQYPSYNADALHPNGIPISAMQFVSEAEGRGLCQAQADLHQEFKDKYRPTWEEAPQLDADGKLYYIQKAGWNMCPNTYGVFYDNYGVGNNSDFCDLNLLSSGNYMYVKLNGQPLFNPTPITIKVPEGNYRVDFYRSGCETETILGVMCYKNTSKYLEASAVCGELPPEEPPEEPTLPWMDLIVSPAATIFIDGEEKAQNVETYSIQLEPGEHRVTAVWPDGYSRQLYADVADSEVHTRVEILREEEPPTEEPTEFDVLLQKYADGGTMVFEEMQILMNGLLDFASVDVGSGIEYDENTGEWVEGRPLKIIFPVGGVTNIAKAGVSKLPASTVIRMLQTGGEAQLAKVETQSLAKVLSYYAQKEPAKVAAVLDKNPEVLFKIWQRFTPQQAQMVYASLFRTQAGRSVEQRLGSMLVSRGLYDPMKSGWKTLYNKFTEPKTAIGVLAGVLGSLVFLTFIGEEAVQTRMLGLSTSVFNKDWETVKELAPQVRGDINAIKNSPPLALFLAIPYISDPFNAFFNGALAQVDEHEALADEKLAEEEEPGANEARVRFVIDPSNVTIEWADFTWTGTTPIEFVVPEGEILWSVSAPNYETETGSVFTTLGEVKTINVTLTEIPPQESSLTISIVDSVSKEPLKANLFVNNVAQPYLLSVYSIKGIDGSVELRATREGYYEKVKTVNVQPGSTVSKTIELIKKEDEEPPVTDGTLVVLSSPNGYVNIAGQPEQITPATFKLRPGSYDVAVSLAGYVSVTRTAYIRTGEETTLSVTLTKETEPEPPPVSEDKAIVSVTSIPSGARIYVDGIVLNYPTPQRLELEGGEHEIKLTKEGYEDYVVRETYEANRSYARVWTLSHIEPTEPPGETPPTEEVKWRVDCSSSPSGAKILVDGSFTGKYTPDYIILLPGAYVIGFDKYGYFPAYVPIDLPEG